MPQECKDFLNAPNHYIAGESYRVSKGKYTLHAENGATVKLTNISAGPIQLSGNLNGTVVSDGTVTFDQTAYTAVRRVALTKGNLVTLGEATQSSSDQDVNRNLYPDLVHKQ